MARAERTIKRLWILCILLIILLVSSYAGFFYYESQFETEKTIVTQDLDTKGSGDAVIYDGVHFNGTREANDNKNQKSQIEAVIDEYIHKKTHRELLKERYIDGLTFEELAEKFDLSVRQTKNIVYTNEKVIFSHI